MFAAFRFHLFSIVTFLVCLTHFVCSTPPSENALKIAMIGTGYVGLVSGACLAEVGNFITCVDVNEKKIADLQEGIMPIYEVGLEELVRRNAQRGMLTFTHDVIQAILDADVIIIAVGTPENEDGSADLSDFYDVIDAIAKHINKHKTIVTKSTVPVGTGKKIRARLESNFGINPTLFSIVSNPEFLREGIAVQDFLHPDRLVIGSDSDKALLAMCKIYKRFIEDGIPYIFTDIQTSEMIKYASNAFLALKISCINEFANLCDATGADIKVVAHAMGLDHRISPYFLNPGPGFGGYCFPKDSQAIAYLARQYNLPMMTIEASLASNAIQKRKPVEKLMALMKKAGQVVRIGQPLAGKKIAILGLAFKPGTDDVRCSPSITTIEELIKLGASIAAYDPAATDNMKSIFPDLQYCKTPYEAVTDADGVIIMTDWEEIKQMDLMLVKDLAKNNPLIFVDTRNCIEPSIPKRIGFLCDSIGRSCHYKKNHYKYKVFSYLRNSV